MTTYLEYVDYPTLPDNLSLSSEDILALPNFVYAGEAEKLRPEYAKKHYFIKRVSPELKEWLINTFPFEITAYYMIFGQLMKPHTDFRKITYNYIIDDGGDDIYTQSYNREFIEGDMAGWGKLRKDAGLESDWNQTEPIITLTSEQAKIKSWMKLQTTVPHGTVGNLTRPRIILSVIPKEDIPIPKNSGLAETILHWRDSW